MAVERGVRIICARSVAGVIIRRGQKMWRWAFILMLPLLLWSAYWGAGAYTLRHGLESALQGQKHGDVVTQYEHAQISGFPGAFKVNMSNVALHQAGVFAWRVPEVTLHAPSYQPQTIRLDVTGAQRIETALGALELTADPLEIGVFLRPALSLPLARAELRAGETSLVQRQENGWAIGFERLLIELQARDSLTQNNVTLSPYDLDVEAVALDLSQIGLDLPPDYQRIAHLHADLSLAFRRNWDISALQQGPPPLDAILIRSIAIATSETERRLTGQLAQEPTGFLSGNLVADVENWRALLVAFREAGYLHPDIADMIIDMLGAQYPGADMTLPLTIENGQVRFGVFILGVLPPLPR
jgi:hypothetical protein